MLEKSAGSAPDEKTPASPIAYSENAGATDSSAFAPEPLPTAREALLRAKTVALVKSSLHPSRQALEKELLRRAGWRKFDLRLVRYKEEADIYVEIGYVSMSWITHRYVFRIYDRRSGIVIAAGETTSWGSLSSNLAGEIVEKIEKIRAT